MIYILPSLVFGFLLGLWFGRRSVPAGPVRSITGATKAPRWEVEALCWRIAKGVELGLQSERDRLKVVPALRDISVLFFDPEKDQIKLRTWGLYRRGNLIKVKAGRGWRKRLCFGLAHALRLKVLGDADNMMKDQLWFRSAFLVLDTHDAEDPVRPDRPAT